MDSPLSMFSGNEKPPRPEGTRRRPRAPGGARSYVRSRLWVRSSFDMNHQFGTHEDGESTQTRSRVRELADEALHEASPRLRRTGRSRVRSMARVRASPCRLRRHVGPATVPVPAEATCRHRAGAGAG